MSKSITTWLESLHNNFEHHAIKALPIEKEHVNAPFSRQVPNACFSKQNPNINLINPKLVAVSSDCLKLLNLAHELPNLHDEENSKDLQSFTETFCGSKLLPGMDPHSHCYSGHQFGAFAGQLGDGTNTLLGVLNDYELQLKGSGKTPYSRTADGKKVLRSSIREFLASEHLHALGIPTTRAATLITSFESKAQRYDATRVLSPREKEDGEGDEVDNGQEVVDYEYCAVVSRVAESFLRFGSFEIVKDVACKVSGKMGPSAGNKELLDTMLKFVISQYYPSLVKNGTETELELTDALVQSFFNEVSTKTAELVAHWQSVGFTHGVLNTDNMSILGLTIDYGPYGFMDYMDLDYTSNFSDNYGRYSFRNQPSMCFWNLQKYCEILTEVGGYKIECSKELYDSKFDEKYFGLMKVKLGLAANEDFDKDFNELLLQTMWETRADFTGTFLKLNEFRIDLEQSNDKESIISNYATEFANELCQTPESMKKAALPLMSNRELINIIRVHQTHRMPIEAIVGPSQDADHIRKQIERLMLFAQVKQAEDIAEVSREKLKNDVQQWHIFLSQYGEMEVDLKAFKNPKIVLRNYLAQEAIVKAEDGDFSGVRDLLGKLVNPFEEEENSVCVPKWADGICVSCSS